MRKRGTVMFDNINDKAWGEFLKQVSIWEWEHDEEQWEDEETE